MHRNYLINAPIRLFIFDNRIELISPGHLPNNLTVEKIRVGNSNIRNPILVSFVAKGLLPYKGLGSGIKRALQAWPKINFVDDRDGCLFTVTVYREEIIEPVRIMEKSSVKSSVKTEDAIIRLLQKKPKMTIRELSENIGVSPRAVEKQIAKLKGERRLNRIGPSKGGYWEVIK